MNFPLARPRQAARGMTMIEIIIVMAVIALLSGTLIASTGMFGGATRRAAATLVIAGVRKGLAQANSTGKPVRMVLDLDNSRIVLEQSSSVEALRTLHEDDDGDKYGSRVAEEAKEEADRILSGKPATKAEFTPLDLLQGDDGKPGRSLGKRIKIRLVQTEHDPEPIESGEAYIFFWPGGVTERAVVQIAKSSDDEGLTVEISPLTGRAKIRRGAQELPESRWDEEGYSEREEL